MSSIFSISTTLPFSPSLEGSSSTEPEKGHHEVPREEPVPAEAQHRTCARTAIIDLMWTVDLRPEIPPAQPLEEYLVVPCDGKEYLLVVPQNWAIQEVMTGLRSEALKALFF